MENRLFFPQSAVDQWGVDGKVDLVASELIVLAEGRRYKVVEAVRVVAEVTGANDDRKIVGKVKPRAALEEIGAEILENSMIIGDNAYDVVPGWIAQGSVPFVEHLASSERAKARGGKPEGAHRSDEEFIKAFAEGSL